MAWSSIKESTPFCNLHQPNLQRQAMRTVHACKPACFCQQERFCTVVAFHNVEEESEAPSSLQRVGRRSWLWVLSDWSLPCLHSRPLTPKLLLPRCPQLPSAFCLPPSFWLTLPAYISPLCASLLPAAHHCGWLLKVLLKIRRMLHRAMASRVAYARQTACPSLVALNFHLKLECKSRLDYRTILVWGGDKRAPCCSASLQN